MKSTLVRRRLVFCVLFLLSAIAQAQVLTDSNLPIVIINTDIDPDTGQPFDIPDDPRVMATMKIIMHPDGTRNYMSDADNPAFLNYDGRISIERRGSSSQQWIPKWPYGLTTLEDDDVSNNNVSLLGMPEENDWVLNSLAWDPSLIRDYLSYNLARMMGNYAPRTEYCEVVVNGIYVGLYILQEKIKADSGRVNIVKITDEDNSVPNLTGGYITKADKTTGGDPVAWTMPSYAGSTEFIHDLPKPEEVTALQNNYIHSQFTALALTSQNDNVSLTNGFPSVIDIPSFIDFMIIAELSSNADAYQLSTFFHKDRDGKLRAGPIWDYNLTYGNDLFEWGFDRSHYNIWQLNNGDNTGAKFWKDLFDNPTYKCYLSRRWHEVTSADHPLKHSNIVTFIDETTGYIGEAAAREAERWEWATDLPGEVAAMKTWLNNRINWIDSHIGGFSACDNVVTPPLVISKINYNPGTSGSFPVANDQEFIEIHNAGTATVTMTGFYFRELGISYRFPAGSTIGAGQSIFLASNPGVFQAKHNIAAFGQFTRNLPNSSQRLELADAWGNVIDYVEYDDDAPWPDADGNGSYLKLIDTALDNALASSWTTSSSTTLGQGEVTLSDIAVFPNPVKDVLTVRVPENALLSICDIAGKCLGTKRASGEETRLDVSGLSKGIYFLTIVSGNAAVTEKIIRQ